MTFEEFKTRFANLINALSPERNPPVDNLQKAFDALSSFMKDISDQIDIFATAHGLEPCKARTAVAAKLIDDMMNMDHAECAYVFALSAAQEARRRILEANPELAAAVEKAMAQPKEH